MGNKFKNKYRIDTVRLKWWDYRRNAAYFVTICTQNREHYFGEIKNGKMNLTEIGKIAHNYWQKIPHHYPFVILGEYVVMPNHVHGIIIINKPVSETVETHDGASHNKNKKQKIVETHSNASKINTANTGNNTNVETHDGASDGASHINPAKIDNDVNIETHDYASKIKSDIINKNKIVETQNFASLPPQSPPLPYKTTNQPDKPVNKFGPQSRNLASIIRGYKSAVKKYATLHGIDFAWQSRYYDHIIRDEQSFLRISEYIKNNPLNWREDKYFE